MKTIATLGVILISTQISFAQESKLWLSLSSGLASPTAENKSNLIGNGFNIEGDAFVPLFRKGWDGTVKGGKFMLGVNVSGNYASLKNLSPNNADIASQYQVFSGTVEVASQSNAKTSSSLSGLVGLQARFSFGKFNVSPSLNTGYLHFNNEGYVQKGSASINGQTRQLDLVKADQQSSGGLVFKPQVRVGYNVTPNFSLFVSPAMMIGHEAANSVQQLVPQGGFNDRKMYEAEQLAKGTWESKTTKSRFNFSTLNFGLSVALGKKKSKPNVKPGGAVSNSYAKSTTPNTDEKINADTTLNTNQRLSMTPTTVRQSPQKMEVNNPLYEGGNGGGENPLAEAKTTTKTKQSQGQTFGEKVATGLQTGANALSQGASLIGGATGGTIKSKDVAVTPPAKAEATDFNTTRSNRERGQLMASPGSPIKGIIVKGGKNPGGNMRLVSNGNGEITLPNLQKGSYFFQLNEAAPAGKSINEKGVKRNEAAAMASPGQPIGGIVVKGGKNPGGNYINLTVNDKGQVGFDVLEAGDYKLIIETPEAPNADSKKKKVVEKATSGLKDTLKTQV